MNEVPHASMHVLAGRCTQRNLAAAAAAVQAGCAHRSTGAGCPETAVDTWCGLFAAPVHEPPRPKEGSQSSLVRRSRCLRLTSRSSWGSDANRSIHATPTIRRHSRSSSHMARGSTTESAASPAPEPLPLLPLLALAPALRIVTGSSSSLCRKLSLACILMSPVKSSRCASQ